MEITPQAGIRPVANSIGSETAMQLRATQEQIRSAAQQFEGLLLHQLLKSAGSEEGGWMGTGDEDSAGLQAMDLALEQFAGALAARGGLGLASMAIPQLTPDKDFTTVKTVK